MGGCSANSLDQFRMENRFNFKSLYQMSDEENGNDLIMTVAIVSSIISDN